VACLDLGFIIFDPGHTLVLLWDGRTFTLYSDACTHVFYDFLFLFFFVVLVLVAIRTLDSKLVLSYFILPLSTSSTSRHDPLSL